MSEATLRLVLGDQLSANVSALSGIDPALDWVMMVEVAAETTYVPHHPKKIALILAAMRQFAQQLRAAGLRVHYVALDDVENTGTFDGELRRAMTLLKPSRLVMTEPGEYRVLTMMRHWQQSLGLPCEIRTDDRFLCTQAEFADWAEGKKQLRLEYFYRQMRKKHQLLVDADDQPIGGQWNYDHDNRAPADVNSQFPARLEHPQSTITQAVLLLVGQRFSSHFGDLEPFNLATTRTQALQDLAFFIEHLLPHFGQTQDAMLQGQAFLHHSLLSSSLNIGLLQPLEVCQQAQVAYHAGLAPLSAVEGFMRQILGWREYVRGIYWRFMPEYATRNTLGATRPLPAFYWGAPTQMNCLSQAIAHTRQHAYSHHIQRLMLTGNFALLAGIDVAAVQAWYLAVYADAFEWVELPNTLGMALYGDDAVVASKPYAASGKYIDRMSDYCASCRYNPQKTTGRDACPFNALYWYFLVKHESRFHHHPRLAMMYRTWHKWDQPTQQAIVQQAENHLAHMAAGTL